MYQWVFLQTHFKHFRVALLACYIYLCIFMCISPQPFDDFADCVGNFKVVHGFIHFLHMCRTSEPQTIQVHANFSESDKLRMLFTKNLQTS